MFYNCHIHTFTEKDVPNRFLPFGLVPILKTTPGSWILLHLLKNLIPFTAKDILDRYARFIEAGKMGSQKAIFEQCRIFYPPGTRFIVLTMDLAHMDAGTVQRTFPEQVDTLGALARPENSEEERIIFPFLHVDPRRDGILDLLKRKVEEGEYFGVKLYPPLGYFPFDPRLDEIYAYCQKKKLPIITHAGPDSPVYFRGKRSKLIELLKDAPFPVDPKGKSKRELAGLLAHPKNYLQVIGRYKKLRICFAHFGSAISWDQFLHHPEKEDNWFDLIRHMIRDYPQFYTDISFTLGNAKFFPTLRILLEEKALRKKILFGSDYYMDKIVTDERKFSIDLRAAIGEKNFNRIATKNPERFLNLSGTSLDA